MCRSWVGFFGDIDLGFLCVYAGIRAVGDIGAYVRLAIHIHSIGQGLVSHNRVANKSINPQLLVCVDSKGANIRPIYMGADVDTSRRGR